MNKISSCNQLKDLRRNKWRGIPNSPGIYWWYFPKSDLIRLNINNHQFLKFHSIPNGSVCLYVGVASVLSKRIKWHGDQHLTDGALRSRFLSTLRFSILAMLKIHYKDGEKVVNCVFDKLHVRWKTTSSKNEARSLEMKELCGEYHYPLNIQHNRNTLVAEYVQRLRSARKIYRKTYLL
ncbi:MAG: hypothetical protein QM796_00245 [Chthoniobacteraceae bacterium]